MVKLKSAFFHIFSTGRDRTAKLVLPAIGLLTFISSMLPIYPAGIIERSYARGLFPKVSYLAGRFADSVPFSWLDVTIPVAVLVFGLLIWRRRWAILLNVVAAAYLLFFWGWGLNYHRQALNTKLQLDTSRTQSSAMTEFARHAIRELNRLYPEKEKEGYDEARTRAEAAKRVRRVVAVIDGSDWRSAERIKVSVVSNPWLHAAGIDGVFNPFGHEPVISDTLLDVERPFVFAHELAHVRGYPDEGDANVVATFATLVSDDPAFQYSGWLNLWFYLRTHELETALDPGPKKDIQRIVERGRAEQIRWISDFQRELLDWFLKANRVEEGVRSYSRVVLLASATEPVWNRFR